MRMPRDAQQRGAARPDALDVLDIGIERSMAYLGCIGAVGRAPSLFRTYVTSSPLLHPRLEVSPS